DLSEFIDAFHEEVDIVGMLKDELKADVLKAYPNQETEEGDDLMKCLTRIAEQTGDRFVFIIDEWDAICREHKPGTRTMDRYVDWLRRMFKGMNAARVFAGVYMTGILPIKKYQTESALNNFQEYSMVEPGDMACYFGFTKEEVKTLAERYGMDINELEKWYDGYQIGDEQSMFNPNSVMQALARRKCRNYWAKTGAFETAADYISMNFEGLKDDVVAMLAGESRPVDPTGFQNDMAIINTKDDVLTVLIHLGYLAYDWNEDECRIPNREVAGELVQAVRAINWKNVFDTIQQSKQLLRATLDGDAEAVARGVDAAHDEETSILSYNNENSMACVLSIAYYYAKNDYIIHRELASGRGFADLVLIPRKNVSSPAIILELKYDKDADTAISQIKRKKYPAKVAQYTDNLLLVGINYDKETKTHSCVIERWGDVTLNTHDK
ncbi:MAG: AAA family ATPase, partial [Prevotella sp.]|nr:AAA family ATPase [Prevotella sp.]